MLILTQEQEDNYTIKNLLYNQYSICGKTRGESVMYFWVILTKPLEGSMKTWGVERHQSGGG